MRAAATSTAKPESVIATKRGDVDVRVSRRDVDRVSATRAFEQTQVELASIDLSDSTKLEGSICLQERTGYRPQVLLGHDLPPPPELAP